eukprot:TRINITY_DN8438_c0_g1_i1.p1 TRINITY_DN8438_c0_g1~~TRINITY_DN8438_c0_g1_i1.p1  ORF type:complete len:442 (-),score=122.97 TRINITY_DN8438_c0_g1_i1:228-1553(-)
MEADDGVVATSTTRAAAPVTTAAAADAASPPVGTPPRRAHPRCCKKKLLARAVAARRRRRARERDVCPVALRSSCTTMASASCSVKRMKLTVGFKTLCTDSERGPGCDDSDVSSDEGTPLPPTPTSGEDDCDDEPSLCGAALDSSDDSELDEGPRGTPQQRRLGLPPGANVDFLILGQDEEEEEEEDYDDDCDSIVPAAAPAAAEESDSLVASVASGTAFNPYAFIAQLPPRSPCGERRCVLPPREEGCPPVTIVLDLDETLLHASLALATPRGGSAPDLTITVQEDGSEFALAVRKRPHLDAFLAEVSHLFEVVVFTASQKAYAGKLLDLLDPDHAIFKHRLYREACTVVCGNYLKDLAVLGRDMSKVFIVDNSPHVYGYQIDNGVPITSWFEEAHDTALPLLLPFLKSLANATDVRPLIRDHYKTWCLVEASRCAPGFA